MEAVKFRHIDSRQTRAVVEPTASASALAVTIWYGNENYKFTTCHAPCRLILRDVVLVITRPQIFTRPFDAANAKHPIHLSKIIPLSNRASELIVLPFLRANLMVTEGVGFSRCRVSSSITLREKETER